MAIRKGVVGENQQQVGVGGILEGKQHTCINSTIGMKNEVLIHLK